MWWRKTNAHNVGTRTKKETFTFKDVKNWAKCRDHAQAVQINSRRKEKESKQEISHPLNEIRQNQAFSTYNLGAWYVFLYLYECTTLSTVKQKPCEREQCHNLQ